MILAEASNEFTGQFIYAGAAIIGLLVGIGSYFATRREVESIEKRVSGVEGKIEEHYQKNQEHASARSATIFAAIEKQRDQLSARIDPLIENTAALKAGQEAQTHALTRFTDVMVELVREKKSETDAVAGIVDKLIREKNS